jgi:hypothetical protein
MTSLEGAFIKRWNEVGIEGGDEKQCGIVVQLSITKLIYSGERVGRSQMLRQKVPGVE